MDAAKTATSFSDSLQRLPDMQRFVLLLLMAALCPLTSAAQELSKNKSTALTHSDALESTIRDMSNAPWKYSETALREHQSAAHRADRLEEEDFTLERGLVCMPTAFVATFESDRHPTVSLPNPMFCGRHEH